MTFALKTNYTRLISFLNRHAVDGPLLARWSIGAIFLQSGWGKLNHLDRTTEFFTSLGIPVPHFHAILVGNVELIGGLFLLLGLLTRLVSLPLMATMMVAIITSALPEVEGLLDFLALDEFLYLAVLLWLVLVGPGRWSLDHIIASKYAS